MATLNLYLSGTCKWAKLGVPDQKYNNFQLDLYPSEKSMKDFINSGLQLQVHESEEGKFIKLRRSVSKVIKGKLVEFGPPTLLDKDNNELDVKKFLVGNGSAVTVKIAVYDTVKGKGHRLEKVRIDELIPYGDGDAEVLGLEQDESPF